MAYLQQNTILESFQLGSRAHHSTESALLKVQNDLLLAVNTSDCAVLHHLKLSAAFDTVDHTILIDRLRYGLGIDGTALHWFISYLKGRSFPTNIGDSFSSPASLCCGVSQSSIRGLILFSVYVPLGQVIQRHGISFHCYAEHTQIYLPLKPNTDQIYSALCTASRI